MYKKLLVLAALMSAVCFTAVAHETLNTQGSYYVAEAKSWKVTIKGQIKKKGDKKPTDKEYTFRNIAGDSVSAAKADAETAFRIMFEKDGYTVVEMKTIACDVIKDEGPNPSACYY